MAGKAWGVWHGRTTAICSLFREPEAEWAIHPQNHALMIFSNLAPPPEGFPDIPK